MGTTKSWRIFQKLTFVALIAFTSYKSSLASEDFIITGSVQAHNEYYLPNGKEIQANCDNLNCQINYHNYKLYFTPNKSTVAKAAKNIQTICFDIKKKDLNTICRECSSGKCFLKFINKNMNTRLQIINLDDSPKGGILQFEIIDDLNNDSLLDVVTSYKMDSYSRIFLILSNANGTHHAKEITRDLESFEAEILNGPDLFDFFYSRKKGYVLYSRYTKSYYKINGLLK
ncbi:hypothetical protein CH371_00010 [Leptospira wolffii]|uniref:VCBS repeat-containing protein n=1 Tax=Leptospira wolffii TaxID=409998 RepID=A0A2M9ZDV8_9LEPT|nr:hypothetical protein [Leptospira wolffii]PJZ66542.1 hypothetical protein CH371_00010 [Leptospira wolffii]